jgi:hypothetical protein
MIHVNARSRRVPMMAASCSEVGPTYDAETIARHLKAGVARMWANLTTSEAAAASEARCQAGAAMIASDLIDKAQRKAREGKPPSDEGLPSGVNATPRPRDQSHGLIA